MLVVPTSTSFTPAAAMTSGRRKEPPISTNWPRETITSLPAATVLSTMAVAAALLLTTVAASAPVSCFKSSSIAAVAPRALAGADVGLQQRVAGQLRGDLPHGPRRQHGPAQRRVEDDAGGVDDLAVMRSARPLGCAAATSAKIVAAHGVGVEVSGARRPATIARAASTAARTASTTTRRGTSAAVHWASAACSRLSTEGILLNNSCCAKAMPRDPLESKTSELANHCTVAAAVPQSVGGCLPAPCMDASKDFRYN